MPTPRYLASAPASSTGEFLWRPRRPGAGRWPSSAKAERRSKRPRMAHYE